MKYENFEQFKLHTKDIHKALVARLKDSAPKLSDIREAVAQSLKYENLATYKASLDKQASQFVKPGEIPVNFKRIVVCIEGLKYDKHDEPLSLALPPNISIRDVARCDWKYQCEIRSEGYLIDQLNEELLSKAIVTDVWAECASLDEYGFPEVADYSICVKAIAEKFNYRVLTALEPSVHDRGDDGSSTIFFELAVDQAFIDALSELELVESDR